MPKITAMANAAVPTARVTDVMIKATVVALRLLCRLKREKNITVPEPDSVHNTNKAENNKKFYCF